MVHSTLCSPETSAKLLRHVGFIHRHAWAGVVGGGWKGPGTQSRRTDCLGAGPGSPRGLLHSLTPPFPLLASPIQSSPSHIHTHTHMCTCTHTYGEAGSGGLTFLASLCLGFLISKIKVQLGSLT